MPETLRRLARVRVSRLNCVPSLAICDAGIYPLHDVHIRKVKVMKRPRFDLTKLMDMHHEGSGKTTATTDPNTGEVVERPEGYEPPVQEAV